MMTLIFLWRVWIALGGDPWPLPPPPAPPPEFLPALAMLSARLT